jgi:hypothetical protein
MTLHYDPPRHTDVTAPASLPGSGFRQQLHGAPRAGPAARLAPSHLPAVALLRQTRIDEQVEVKQSRLPSPVAWPRPPQPPPSRPQAPIRRRPSLPAARGALLLQLHTTPRQRCSSCCRPSPSSRWHDSGLCTASLPLLVLFTSSLGCCGSALPGGEQHAGAAAALGGALPCTQLHAGAAAGEAPAGVCVPQQLGSRAGRRRWRRRPPVNLPTLTSCVATRWTTPEVRPWPFWPGTGVPQDTTSPAAGSEQVGGGEQPSHPGS